jgi:hypothetical protein
MKIDYFERISEIFSEIEALLFIKPLPTTATSTPHEATIDALCALMPPSIINFVFLPPEEICSSIAALK